jgi:hypothetical protein
MKYGFQQQLKVGEAGQGLFLKLHPELEQTDGKTVDFIDNKTGERIELKTDTYDSGNFFIERYSDYVKQSVGGPWQTQSKDGDLYVYMFLAIGKIYWFNVDELVGFMDKWIDGLTLSQHNRRFKLIKQRGARYETAGYIIPIEELEGLAFQTEDIK